MKHIRNFFAFVFELYKQRYIISQLVKRDFQNKYMASYLGLPWAFIQPLMSVVVIWFAMTYGLRVGKTETGLPYSVWFICGMIPWLFISEALVTTSGSLIEYSYLIKKTAFRVAIIPFIKIFTALIIHLFFIIFLAIFAMAYGFYPDIYWLQLIYFVFASFVLLAGLGWLISAINVFVRDVGQIVNVAINILFWATPIIWPYSMLTGNLKYIALINPFFYIIEGYRKAILMDAWLLHDTISTIYFWGITSFIFILGSVVFIKLTPHFSDVL
ncbi:MAG: ABC transporter permease [Bacteroidales bacterium]|nr:ABC transporter permease [Bacteroidales bacterium]MCF8387417.1 ABC transporter permease [Bacteroidales bacterium]MCF8399167.1 ABC transporter permease [Bacteroidales bacterium]